MTIIEALIRYLSDGRTCTVNQLSQHLQVSPSVVHQLIQQLSVLDIEIKTAEDGNICFVDPLILLDLKRIKYSINTAEIKRVKSFEILDQISSTNTYLMKYVSSHSNKVHICLAEWQREGRGRLDRKWVSPYGANLYLSMLWPFQKEVNRLSGLSLMIGTVVADVLVELGIKEIGLKWPNDIQFQNKKIGGILIDIASELHGRSQVILGIGLNVNMPSLGAKKIHQPWVDLKSVLRKSVDRNFVAGKLIHSLLEGLAEFEQSGLGIFLERWEQLDILRNKVIRVLQGDQIFKGMAVGVDETGCLLVKNQWGQLNSISTGSVYLDE